VKLGPENPIGGLEPSVEGDPYCDYCERYGHTFRTCENRDDSD
jgi:hypothetical protein